MPLSVFIEMTLSAILTVWSPGPNNILLLSTASKYGISGNLERFSYFDVSFRTVLQHPWKGGSGNPACDEVSGCCLCAVSGMADLAPTSALRCGTGEKAHLAHGLFPAAGECEDYHLWTDYVFRLYSAL